MKRPHLPNFFHGHRAPVGAVPGTLLLHPDAEPPVVTVTRYGPDAVDTRCVTTAEEIKALWSEGHPVTWINIDGLADLHLVTAIGEMFDFHRLAMGDVLNITQRPKSEDYGNFLFVINRMPSLNGDDEVEIEQISYFLRDGVLVTFQEAAGDCWNPVRDRIRQGRGIIRHEKADYLLYALLDSVVDAYFPILEHYGDKVEALNDRIMDRADPKEMREMHMIRQELITLRRAIWPQRDVFSSLIRDQKRFVGETTAIYLRDCYDHSVQLLDLVETYREIAATSMELYISSVNNRMNEIMKVLTVIATIFIPLSFIASVYGMNFDVNKSPLNMPELEWKYGYLFALGLMLLTAGSLLVWFWRRGWIGFGKDKKT
jgi:magnesium transporter